MAFDATISLGNILTAAGTIGGLLWAYHKWDSKIEIRHNDQKNQIEKMDAQVDRVESKIDENTKTTNGVAERVADLNIKVEKHLISDEVYQKNMDRRMDRLEK